MFILITAFTNFASFLFMTCLNYLRLFTLILFTIDATPLLYFTYSFFIICSLVTLFIHLRFPNSVTLIFFYIFPSPATHSKPYNKVHVIHSCKTYLLGPFKFFHYKNARRISPFDPNTINPMFYTSSKSSKTLNLTYHVTIYCYCSLTFCRDRNILNFIYFECEMLEFVHSVNALLKFVFIDLCRNQSSYFPRTIRIRAV